MKTTTSPPPKGENVVLITGGESSQDNKATRRSVEIFLPNSPSQPCILPDLPDQYFGHTQDGGMICGGHTTLTENVCRQWNPTEGIFPDKPVHIFKPARYFHVSWTPVSENETFLMGGGSTKERARNTSTIIQPGIYSGPYFNFTLKYPLNAACSIPDPETDTVIITGGNYDTIPRNRITSLYNEDGWVLNLGNLKYPRRFHGCTSYVANKKRVQNYCFSDNCFIVFIQIFLVTGGYDYSSTGGSYSGSLTTEILEDKNWTVLPNGNIPISSNPAYTYGISGLRLATIDNNQVFAFGKMYLVLNIQS